MPTTTTTHTSAWDRGGSLESVSLRRIGCGSALRVGLRQDRGVGHAVSCHQLEGAAQTGRDNRRGRRMRHHDQDRGEEIDGSSQHALRRQVVEDLLRSTSAGMVGTEDPCVRLEDLDEHGFAFVDAARTRVTA